MKMLRYFEKGEEVFIKMQVVSAVLDCGDFKYQLKDPVSGRCSEFRYSSDNLYFVEPIQEQEQEQGEVKNGESESN